jgi:hypothetical protein
MFPFVSHHECLSKSEVPKIGDTKLVSPATQPNYVLPFVEIERASVVTVSLDISWQYFTTGFGIGGEQERVVSSQSKVDP